MASTLKHTSSLGSQDFDNEKIQDPPSYSPSEGEDMGRRPIWKKMLVGSANGEFETKRALGSRHIMMIGESCSSAGG